MKELRDFRAGKPGFYPDQAIYAEFACAEFGLSFQDLANGAGLLFRVASKTKSLHFGAGRCTWYPQNSATAATLASDKYFTHRVLEEAGIATLGGEYFFLHERHRAHRPPGHERHDAIEHFKKLGAACFIKPLQGSRGDFAQTIHGEASLDRYLEEVSFYYDSILIQPIFTGAEYRIFLLDGDVVFSARKYPPFVVGDGVRSIRELLIAHNASLTSRGLSQAPAQHEASLDIVLPAGERMEIPGRMNMSAGGNMQFEAASEAALVVAGNAARALGLRVAAVDLFTEVDGEATAIRVIEVNANPSIRMLETTSRGDVILKIWHHTFHAMGLL
jgi:D-alanine-D-alanine ligase-like ATP-grasp enzyme